MKAMDEFIEIPVLEEGIVYHYTSLQAIFGIVGNKEFWVTKSDYLNDYDELSYTVRLFREVLISSDVFVDIDLKERILKSFNKYIEQDKDDVDGGYYILSFSRIEDNLTLWAEFSDSMGYNIGFDIVSLTDSISESQRIIWQGEVIYNREEQIELLNRAIINCAKLRLNEFGVKAVNQLNNELSDQQIDLIGIDMFVACSVYAMFFKNSLFAAEKEYRIVIAGIHQKTDKFKEDKLYYRDKNGTSIPYIIINHDPLASVKSIMIGPKNTSDNSVNGIKLYCTHHSMNNVQVKKSDITLRY